jgi:hypothetical protein
MDTTITPFHTATIEHPVPGELVDMAALAYNLQYTQPLVDELVAGNPPARRETQLLRIGQRELVRLNWFGAPPRPPRRRICVIGIGDAPEPAERAAQRAWFDYHASVLFSQVQDGDAVHTIVFHQRVPGLPAQRATTVGVALELEFLARVVGSAVARNAPTFDELQVVQAGELTLMRVNLYGMHPLETNRRICVGGIADRHYRAVAAAERAWADYHTALLFAAYALGAR